MSAVLLSQESIATSITGAVAHRIRYASSDLHGKATESTGLVITPAIPGHNRKILSWAHGTTGLGDAASPSLQTDPARELVTYFQSGSVTQIDYGIPGLQSFIDNGWVVVATDYQGLGTPGVHQYTVNRTNALDAVNIVHAAREMDLDIGTKFGVIGWSQGGGTAAAVAELDSSAYGELQLVGTVAMSPGVPGVAVKLPGMGAALAGGGAATPPDGHLYMILAGMTVAFPDTLSLHDVFTPLGAQIFEENYNTAPVHHLSDIVTRAFKHQGAILDVKKEKLPAWLQAFELASAGQVKPNAPVLVLIDGQDPNGPCPLPWQLGYIDAIKALGGDITSSTYPDDDHFSLPQSSIGEAMTWLTAKF
jgi:pimeloyl-ACP methyl ester carboxylesterase